MSTTLTYGHKRPDDGDDSAQWFNDLEDNIILDDSHSHNGIDSALLSTQSIGKVDVITKAVADWGGSIGAWTLTIPNGEIPAGFKSVLKSTSELTSLKVMDSDSNDEQVFMKVTHAGIGNTATITLTSNTKRNLKILFL